MKWRQLHTHTRLPEPGRRPPLQRPRVPGPWFGYNNLSPGVPNTCPAQRRDGPSSGLLMTSVSEDLRNPFAVEQELSYQAAELVLQGLAGVLGQRNPTPSSPVGLSSLGTERRAAEAQPVETQLRL